MKRVGLILLASIGLSFLMVPVALTEVWDHGEFAYQVSNKNAMVTVNPGGRGDALISPYL